MSARGLAVLLATLVTALAAAPSAAAATCSWTGPIGGGSWHVAGHWSCGEVPGADDAVSMDNGDLITVTEAVSVASLSTSGGQLSGTGSVTVAGTFTKSGGASFGVLESVDLELDGDGSVQGGTICLSDSGGADDPTVLIDGELTLAAGADLRPFGCGVSSGRRVHVRATGELVVDRSGATESYSVIENDGLVSVRQGSFRLLGGTAGTVSEGDYVVAAGATLEFSGNGLTQTSASTRVGGEGTVRVSAVTFGGQGLQLAAGATFDPAVLEMVNGILELDGTTALALPEVDLRSGVLDTDRPLTVAALDVEGGTLRGSASVTVPATGSFTKTTGGRLTVSGSTDLVLDVDATIAGGSVCLDESPAGDANLLVNKQLTIGPDAAAAVFSCGTSVGPRVRIAAGDGHLVYDRPGTGQSLSQFDNDGRLTVRQGTFQIIGTGGAVSEGAHVAEAGATLEFKGNRVAELGTSARVGGAGTVHVSAVVFSGAAVQVSAGATVDPGVLLLTGHLAIGGTDTLALPDVRIEGGTLDSSRAITATSLSTTNGFIRGGFTLTVPAGGTFTKTTGGQLHVTQSDTTQAAPDLVLDVDATIAGGTMCVGRSNDSSPDRPRLVVNRTLTIGPGAAPAPFPCDGASPNLHVSAPSGRLVKDGAGTTTINTGIENDGEVRAGAGTLAFSGTPSGATSEGAFVADAGATLRLGGRPLPVAGRLGGPGTIDVSSVPATVLLDGAVVDPAHLRLSGDLTLAGDDETVLPVLRLAGGRLQSSRPVRTTTAFLASHGFVEGDFVLTTPSFVKQTTGQLRLANAGDLGTPDLVLTGESRIEEGTVCLARTGGAGPDQPHLDVRAPLTLHGAAPLPCLGGPGTAVRVNGPGGHLRREGAGTTAIATRLELSAGRVSAGAGQRLDVATFVQSGGVTELSGGTLGGTLTLTGGALRGTGTVDGDVVNTAGTVAPGTSPGTLTVTGDYNQGDTGTLEVEIGGTDPGTEHDRLAVGGDASLAGRLAIVTTQGHAPAVGDAHEILAAAALTGTFDAFTGDRTGNRRYDPRYDADSVTLVAEEGPPGPATPTISGTDPASPSPERDPRVQGSAPGADAVDVFLNGSCTGAPAASGSPSSFAGDGIPVEVPSEASTTITVRSFGSGAFSACSASVTYVNRVVELTATDPASPSDERRPFVRGSAPAGAQVAIYADETCSGTALEIGSAEDLAGSGIPVTVPADTRTTLRARVLLDGEESGCSADSIEYVHRYLAPPALTATDPASPSNDRTPLVRGTAPDGDGVEIYGDASCSGTPLGGGSPATLAGAGIEVDVPPNATTTLYARVWDTLGRVSACSAEPLEYVHRFVAVPTLTGTEPPSPGTDLTPLIRGSAPGADTVALFTNEACSGTPAEVAAAEDFADPGMEVTVAEESTTTFYARAQDEDGNPSACSTDSVTYTHVFVVAPTFTGTTPASPADDSTPLVRGSAPGAQTVSLFANADCSGTPLAQGSAAAFAGEGIEAPVADDATTTFRARAADSAGRLSPCSTDTLTYVEQTTPPAPVLTGTTPASGADDNQPFVRGTVVDGVNRVFLYTDAACATETASGSAVDFERGGIRVTVPDDSTTTFRARARDLEGDLSACSTSSITYVENSLPPAPSLTETVPASPADENRPRVRGSVAPGVDQVRLFRDAACTLTLAVGTAAEFTGPGIEVFVPNDSTTTIRAQARGADGDLSPCSTSSITYEERTTPPAPVFTGTTPASPADENFPFVRGTVAPGVVEVRLYRDDTCTGGFVFGPASSFTGAGLRVGVADDSTTRFRARAVDGEGDVSACSTSSVTYVEETPDAPPATTPPPSPAPPSPAPPSPAPPTPTPTLPTVPSTAPATLRPVVPRACTLRAPCTVAVSVPGPGVVRLADAAASTSRPRPRPRPRPRTASVRARAARRARALVATVTVRARRAGRVQLRVRPTAHARRLLRRRRSLTARIVVTWTAPGRPVLRSTVRLPLRRTR